MPRWAFIGVDPGKKGAICALFSDNTVRFHDLGSPVPEWKNFLLEIEKEVDHIAPIVIEDVHSILGMSAKSNFSFGYNVGQINAILDLTNLGKDPVTAKTWQRTLRVPAKAKGPAIKHAVRDLVLALYPTAREKLFGPKGGYIDGRGDALGIAHHCRVKYGGMA